MEKTSKSANGKQNRTMRCQDARYAGILLCRVCHVVALVLATRMTEGPPATPMAGN